MAKKCWIFSLDALGSDDAAIFENLPGFQRLIKEGAYVSQLRGVYPTLTYPSHATIITGRYPDSHGIVNNRRRQPDRSKQAWYWYARDIQGDTLFKAGKRAGKTIAAFLWPVNANAEIDHNFAEIFPTQYNENQTILSLRNSKLRTILPIEFKFSKYRDGVKQPNLDNYTEKGISYIIDKDNPDMVFVHFIGIDSFKHQYGAHTKEVEEAIVLMDERVQRILSYWEEHLDKEDIDLIFLSDHSQKDTSTYLYILDDFRDQAFLEEQNEAILHYKAYPHSAGGSCYVYLHENYREDTQVKTDLEEFLRSYVEKTEGVDRLYLQEDLQLEHADPQAFAMVEAKEGYAFSEYFAGTEFAQTEKKFHLANHGFHPDKKDYDSIFFGLGPSFKEGYREEERKSLVDIGPTLAKILGLSLKNPSGQVMSSLLR